jgi:hypothetical protein
MAVAAPASPLLGADFMLAHAPLVALGGVVLVLAVALVAEFKRFRRACRAVQRRHDYRRRS